MAIYFGEVRESLEDGIYLICVGVVSLENKERSAAMALVTLNFDVALQYLKRIPNGNGCILRSGR